MSRRADANAEFWALAAALVVTALAGIGTILLADPHALEWINGVALPEFAAPFWVYVLGWTCVYIASALAVWLVWREAGWRASRPHVVQWIGQLAVIAGWCYVLFLLHRTGWALIGIAALFVSAGVAAYAFRHLSRLAAVLMLACAGWFAYAGLVNLAIWNLSR